MAVFQDKSELKKTLPPVIVVMGVSGSGKTIIGNQLAQRLNYAFVDADDFHSAANIEKMRSGHPLNDNDRLPWLNTLAQLIADAIKKERRTVLACSALKQTYRDAIAEYEKGREKNGIRFVYLKGSFDLFQQRLASRQGHYMKSNMLQSQFASLEEPQNALVIDASLSVEQIIDACVAALNGSAQ